MIRMVCVVLHNKHMRTHTRRIGLFGSFSMVCVYEPLFLKCESNVFVQGAFLGIVLDIA